jgi:hypothetical protein
MEALGGVEGILGDYLDQAVAAFPPERTPLVRRLLGALVTSGGLRQRLNLDELARAGEAEPPEVAEVLEKLNRQGLVRRFGGSESGEGQGSAWYELTHDVLIPRIVRWLGDDFWSAQRAREIVRMALPDWLNRSRLLAPEDLRLVNAQVGTINLSTQENRLIYASAAAYGERPGGAAGEIPDGERREILLRLIDHPQPGVRRRVIQRLSHFADEKVSAALAGGVMNDPETSVREAAAHAIARSGDPYGSGEVDRGAVEALVSASEDPQTREAAKDALVAIRDLDSDAGGVIPESLRREVRRRLWARRWRRNRQQVWSETLGGLQSGFWGLALGMGLFFGLWNASASLSANNPLRIYLGVVLLGMSLAGVLGALAVGGGTLTGAVLRALTDRDHPWRTWALVAVVSALSFALGMVLIGYVSAGTPRPLTTALAGALMGALVAGGAALPIELPRFLHLGLVAALGVGVFILVGALGLFFNQEYGWLVLMGAASGVGFYLGLDPDD